MESKLVIVLFVHCLVAFFIVSHSLLKRRILVDEKSNSENVPVGNLFSYDEKYTGWLPAVNEKVVLVVIDALRNDFAFKEESKSEIVHNEAGFFKSIFLSDPPTTTSQRLVGIASGTFPTYLESFFNFNARVLKGSDSFVNQIWAKYPATSAFFGDNTWTELFPVILAAEGVSKGFHSFNMFDLIFVDDSIYECMDKFLNEGKMHSTNFLALHLLGLDHAGHTFDAKHDSIQGKLAEYNTFIRRITNEMPQNASLFIFGNHGMTESGDHGGESWNELATCICHWRKGWESQDEQRVSEFQVLFERVEQIRRKYNQYAAGINQVDFAATLCIIMGQKRENILFLSLFSWHAFFFAGHSWQPTAIQWDRAFFGTKSFNQICGEFMNHCQSFNEKFSLIDEGSFERSIRELLRAHSFTSFEISFRNFLKNLYVRLPAPGIFANEAREQEIESTNSSSCSEEQEMESNSSCYEEQLSENTAVNANQYLHSTAQKRPIQT